MLESTFLKEISLPIGVPVTGPPRQGTETPQGAFIMSLLRNERCDFYRGMATETGSTAQGSIYDTLQRCVAKE